MKFSINMLPSQNRSTYFTVQDSFPLKIARLSILFFLTLTNPPLVAKSRFHLP
ncbi:hypothetical protein THF1C08_170060 [Vibrio jasicida]|uniref:Uncharacterized protein n=1 Tax=Vibrio jasicida TaxID=766224 RepID=A0AAU9QHG8_9VIBR|nr:hypothetical protein THF1C08_170060 [Vibrio jasicida]CAH1580097.1 hypothetical protein THF1A12_160058 [Vibrio jasicida]